MGKLVVIESGTDASGKETQTNILYDRLKKEGYKVIKFTFPNYDSISSSLVKMYLNGDFGEDPDHTNPYITSTFFAVDRYATYKKDIEKYYKDDEYIVILDRYTTSNMTYQASKISGLTERDEFLDWLYNYEFKMYGLPVPDLVIFLDMPVETAQDLLKLRNKKGEAENKKDIHENNLEYLRKSYYNAKYVSAKYKWDEVLCLEDGELRSVEDIANEIYCLVKKKILK